ncbi:MAG: hypothetical protein V3W24_02415 [Gemmatimonadota bacterium]
MLVRSFSRHIRDHDWLAVIVEVFVVAVGLLMAFQVDRWWEERGEREQEAAYVQRLIDDLEDDIVGIDQGIELAEVRQEFAELLMDVSADPALAERQPMRFLAAVMQAPYTFTPSLSSHTFEDLRSTGNLGLIRSNEVKDALYRYYGFDEGQRQFMQLNFMIEFRHFSLAAAVLSHEQFKFIENEWFVVTRDDLDDLDAAEGNMEEVRAAVARFSANDELQAWLTRVLGVQKDLQWVHGRRRSLAEDALKAMRAYQARLEG